jgi:hypothetical protein
MQNSVEMNSRSSGGYRCRTHRRPRPRCRVFFPGVFELPMDLIFTKTPRFDDIGPANLAIRGRGRERCADEQELIAYRVKWIVFMDFMGQVELMKKG